MTVIRTIYQDIIVISFALPLRQRNNKLGGTNEKLERRRMFVDVFCDGGGGEIELPHSASQEAFRIP